VTGSAGAPRVSVVIVNFNGGFRLDTCLVSLAAQSFRSFRTIVVDNASVDGSADDLETRYPGVRVLRSSRNLGFAGGNNLAFRETRDDDWVVLLNPDAVAAPGWLEGLLQAAAGHPEFGMFGCRMFADPAGERLDGVGDAYHVSGLPWRIGYGAHAAGRHGAACEIFAPCGAAVMYRADVLAATGGFDEDFFCYLEDVDLAFRARLLGHRALYVPNAVVVHEGSGIVGRHSDFQLYHGHRNLVWTFVRNMPGPLLAAYLPAHIALNLVTLAVFGWRGRGGVLLRAKLDALRGLGPCLRKRRETQRTRRVGSRTLLAVMARGIPRPRDAAPASRVADA
jgi:GT2 family glycosyltransferase